MSQHDAVKGAHTEGLVTSDSVQAKRGLHIRLPRWWKYAVLVLVAVVVIAGAGYYIWKHPITRTPAVKDSAAVTAALASVQQASTPAGKQAAYITLGTAYLNSAQPGKAAGALKQAIAYSGSPNDIPTLEELATAQEMAGDKTGSIATLQQVVAILKTQNDPASRNLVYRYQAEIKKLQGGK